MCLTVKIQIKNEQKCDFNSQCEHTDIFFILFYSPSAPIVFYITQFTSPSFLRLIFL